MPLFPSTSADRLLAVPQLSCCICNECKFDGFPHKLLCVAYKRALNPRPPQKHSKVAATATIWWKVKEPCH